MTLQVVIEKTDGGLADLFGAGAEVAEALKDASEGLTAATKAVLTALDAVSVIENLIVGLVDNPVVALLKKAIRDLAQRIQDFRKTGVYLLPIGFSVGPPGSIPMAVGSAALNTFATGSFVPVVGLGGLKSTLQLALTNARDPSRPSFGPNAYTMGTLIAGFGIPSDVVSTITQAADRAKSADGIREIIKSIFLTSPIVQAMTNVQTYLVNTDLDKTFQDAYAAYRIANSPTPPAETPWAFQTLEDLLPGFGDIFLEIEARLNALLSLFTALTGLKAFFDLVKAALLEIENFIRVLDGIVTFLNLLLTRFPLIQFRWGPTLGGATEIAASLQDWFDPSQHPELQDIAPNSLMVGIMLLAGSASLDESDAQQAIYKQLLKFGI